MTTPTPAETSPGLFRRTIGHHAFGLLAVWLVLSLVALSTIYVQIWPTYRSYSSLRFEPPSSTLYGIKTNEETWDHFLKTQVQLFTSPNVLTAAATNPKVAKLARIRTSRDVILDLKNLLQVQIVPETTLIEVSMTSPDPSESAVVVNAVVDAYLTSNEEWANSMSRQQIKSLEDYLKDLEAQTDELERQWKELVVMDDRDDFQKPDENGRQMATIDQYKEIKNQLLHLHLELVQAQAWANELKQDATRKPALGQSRQEAIVLRKFRTDPEVIELAEKMREAQQKLDSAKKLVRSEGDPAVKSIERKLAALQEKYNKLWETKSNAYIAEIELTSAIDFDERQLREAELKVRELQVKEAALKKAAGELEISRSGRSSTNGVKIQLILDQRASIKSMQEAVTRRLEQLRYESRGETRVRKINEAVPTMKPVKNLRPVAMIVAPIVMLFATFGLFLTLESTIGRKPKVEPTIDILSTEPTPESPLQS